MATVRLPLLLLLLLIVQGRGRRHLREEEKRLLPAPPPTPKTRHSLGLRGFAAGPAQVCGLPGHTVISKRAVVPGPRVL